MIGVFVERFDTDPANADMASGGGVGDLVAAKPAIIKVMGSRAQLQWAHKQLPGTVYVYRDIANLEEPFYGNAPGAAFADIYWRAIRPFVSGIKFAAINVWPNEPDVSPASLDQLDAYYMRLAQLARADGFTIAAGAFSAEGAAALVPDGRWRNFAGALAALKQYGHWLDLHGYFSPHLNDPDCVPYLFPWRALRKAAGDILPRILCGEFGVDSILGMGRIHDGYRTVMSNGSYASELLWADAQLKKDNVPATVYLATRANGPDDQVMYNILLDDSKRDEPNPSVWSRIRDSIADVYQQGPVELPPVEPPPVTPPSPIPPYEATVVMDGLNLRDGNADTSRLIKSLPVGTSVTVLGEGRRVNVRVVIEGTVLKSGLTPK